MLSCWVHLHVARVLHKHSRVGATSSFARSSILSARIRPHVPSLLPEITTPFGRAVQAVALQLLLAACTCALPQHRV